MMPLGEEIIGAIDPHNDLDLGTHVAYGSWGYASVNGGLSPARATRVARCAPAESPMHPIRGHIAPRL